MAGYRMVLRRQRKGDKMRWRKLFQGVAVAAVAMLFASACLSEEGGGGGASSAAEGDGQVEILFGFGGDQSKGFQDGLNQWAQANGVTVKFSEASQSFDTIIRTRVQGNNLPDIALFPQPGLIFPYPQRSAQDEPHCTNCPKLVMTSV
jgi:alpha-glucoside transport system substrate-binding protein